MWNICLKQAGGAVPKLRPLNPGGRGGRATHDVLQVRASCRTLGPH